jgi:lipoate-protein ligase A
MPSRLRVIDDGARTATFNMAADLFLLDTCPSSNDVFLRLYDWDPPAISIGYMQKAEQVLDLEACAAAGRSWIRRPTGGRAVLHEGDITYSCVFAKNVGPMGRSVAQTYELISSCLIAGLVKSGIRCEPHHTPIDSKAARREVKLPCFLAPNRREIMVAGRKLVGSAQKRTAHAVLQHGSIPFSSRFRDLPRYEPIAAELRTEHVRLLHAKCACIREVLPSSARERIRDNLKRGFAEVLHLDVAEEPWTAAELASIAALAGSESFAAQWRR